MAIVHHEAGGHRAPPRRRAAAGGSRLSRWTRWGSALAVLGVLTGLLVSPVAWWASGRLIRAGDLGASPVSDAGLLAGRMPVTTTIEDATGRPIAYLYAQDRVPVTFDHIAGTMTAATVAIEDRGFWSEGAVDPRAVIRAAIADVRSGGIAQGASTLSQQYVKNYEALVAARNPAQRAAATARTVGRKIHDIRLAVALDAAATKREVLADYLNVISFGHGAFGIDSAARTYFDTTPEALTLEQAALLAGIVNNPSAFDPVDHPRAATARRNTVLGAMADQHVIPGGVARRAAAEPLGVVSPLDKRPRGCDDALAGAGFFCDEVVSYLEDHGLGPQQLETGGYTIRTTLDPVAQQAANDATARTVDPSTEHAADVLALVRPGAHRHAILALAGNRTLSAAGGPGRTAVDEAVRPVPFGAGSVYKLFTAAVAMRQGLGVDSVLPVPSTYSSPHYLGPDGAPAVVENAGTYPSELSLTDALATSPNTTFVQLEQQVGLPEVVHEAISMGLTDLARPAESGDPASSPAARILAGHDLSFTLGVTPTSPLQLANVGATLASDGIYCPPTPVDEVSGADGLPVPIRDVAPCHRAMPGPEARSLAHALGRDAVTGTSAVSARRAGWTRPVSAKTGTTQHAESTAFVAFTSRIAGASMVFDDTADPGPLCQDDGTVHGCTAGGLFGGQAAGLTWYRAVDRVLGDAPPTPLPEVAPGYADGQLPS